MIMDPLQPIFNSLSTLTNGLISDMSTAIMGMLVIMFILMGLERLKDILEVGLFKRRAEKYYEELGKQEKGTFGHDYAVDQYRGSLNKISSYTRKK